MKPPTVNFPDIAWTGLFARYRDLVAPCTEAPPEFHFASFIAAVGALVGRRAWIKNPHPAYPNFYSLLIGETAQARKTTAYQFALRLLDDGAGVLQRNVQKLYGLASVEGLATTMQAGDVLCVEDEFRSLVTKGGRKAVANTIPKMTELFNCPEAFEVNTRTNPIRVQRPFLAMLSASTPAWFEKSLSKSDVSGGFLNRWLLFHGRGGQLLPFPPPLDEREWGDLVLDICIAIESEPGVRTFSQAAKDSYGLFYTETRARSTSEAASRMDLHAKKLALLYSVLDGRSEISISHVTSACAVAEYCGAVVEPLAARLEISSEKRDEERFLESLASGPVPERDAYRRLHMPAGRFRSMVAPLRAINQVTYDDGKYALAK